MKDEGAQHARAQGGAGGGRREGGALEKSSNATLVLVVLGAR